MLRATTPTQIGDLHFRAAVKSTDARNHFHFETSVAPSSVASDNRLRASVLSSSARKDIGKRGQ